MEDELEQAFDRQVEQGVQRLSRSWREILATGFVAGTDIAFGVIAFVLVMDETGNQLLGAIAFTIGPLALMLGRSELFTEGFLVPVVTVVAKKARPAQLAKLWSGTLVANLVGGWLIMWLIVLAFPALHEQMISSAEHYATAPLSVETFCLVSARRHGDDAADPHAAGHRGDGRPGGRLARRRVPAGRAASSSTRCSTRC